MKQSLIIALLAITFSANAQLGIGTGAPDASAQLDVTSTTKGLLPPRMTAAQRDAILAPANGLMIYCFNCATGEPEYYNGTSWLNMIGGAAADPYVIGQAALGGKIAYILVSGDPGYSLTVQHGLVAATADQSTGIQWYNGTYTTTGATGTVIGTGSTNTSTIITSQGATATNYAAGVARAYTGGGYGDWFLPSRDELNKLYLNRVAIGFAGNGYWSSTEVGGNVAWLQDFAHGNQDYVNKNATAYVCAIRAF